VEATKRAARLPAKSDFRRKTFSQATLPKLRGSSGRAFSAAVGNNASVWSIRVGRQTVSSLVAVPLGVLDVLTQREMQMSIHDRSWVAMHTPIRVGPAGEEDVSSKRAEIKRRKTLSVCRACDQGPAPASSSRTRSF